MQQSSDDISWPPTGQEIVDLVTVLALEIVAAVSPTSSSADQRLEDVASRLIDFANGTEGNLRLKALMLATAKNLIQTESPAGGE